MGVLLLEMLDLQAKLALLVSQITNLREESVDYDIQTCGLGHRVFRK
jgi:hypothetical protein